MIPKFELGDAQALVVGVEIIGANAAVEDLGLLVDGEDLRLVQLLEDVAHAQDDDLVADDQDAAVAIVQVDGVHHRPQAEDDVGPAFAARSAVIEFAEHGAVGRFLRIFVADTNGRQAVEHAELALAQALVDDRLGRAAGEGAG